MSHWSFILNLKLLLHIFSSSSLLMVTSETGQNAHTCFLLFDKVALLARVEMLCLALSPGNSLCVEWAEAVHQRRVPASQKLVPVRGHHSVAEGRGRWRSLHGRAAHLPHLLFLEEKQEVRGTWHRDPHTDLIHFKITVNCIKPVLSIRGILMQLSSFIANSEKLGKFCITWLNAVLQETISRITFTAISKHIPRAFLVKEMLF